MARNTRKPSVSETLTKPTLQSLSPRDALAVELMLETVRSRGKIAPDMVDEIVRVSNAAAVQLGWSKPKKSPKQEAEEVLDNMIEPTTTEVE